MDEQNLYITPSRVAGTLTAPPSKSHTLRAILFAMLAESPSTVLRPLPSPDMEAMCHAIEQFGARVDRFTDRLEILPGFCAAENVIDAGNSGLVLRLIGAVAGLLPSYTIITGDASLRQLRPITPLLEGLNQLGAFATSAGKWGRAPIIVCGPMKPGRAILSGRDSQPVSGLLIATSFLDGPSELIVKDPGETPWIDLNLSWLKMLRGRIEHENYQHYWIEGNLSYSGFTYEVPGDFSTAAFPLAAALVTGSTVTVTNLDFNDAQGDKVLLQHLSAMGAEVLLEEGAVTVAAEKALTGVEIDLEFCIDALPILAVLGCFCNGMTRLYNGRSARFKESDRIAAIAKELRKMGGQIQELEDGLLIQGSALHGAEMESHADHRIAMALSVAALGADSPSVIHNARCIDKTYGSFVTSFRKIGAEYGEQSIR